MPAGYSCPFCGAVIGVDDVNVATDIALCRACGKTSSFAMISGASAPAWDATAPPPKWVRVENDFRGATRITYRRLSPLVWFLIPFTAFWSGLSMWGIYGTQLAKGQFNLTQSLFGLPFLFGTIVLVSILVFSFVGKWVITLDHGAGSVFVGVGTLGWTRRFTYDRRSLVSLRMTSVQVNHVPQQGILIRSDDKDFVFGTMLKDEAKRFVAFAIWNEVVKT